MIVTFSVPFVRGKQRRIKQRAEVEDCETEGRNK